MRGITSSNFSLPQKRKNKMKLSQNILPIYPSPVMFSRKGPKFGFINDKLMAICLFYKLLFLIPTYKLNPELGTS